MTATRVTEMVTIVTRTCIHCGEQGTVTITTSQRDALDRGAFVQDALSGVDRAVREQVVSGTHPGCWNALTDPFGTDEDDTDKAEEAARVEEEPASRFLVALEAFEAEWDAKIGAHEATFALWEPDVDDDAPSIGIARPDAGPAEVVYITLHDPASPIELTAAATGERIYLARAARILAVAAPSVRAAITAATAGLHAAHRTGR